MHKYSKTYIAKHIPDSSDTGYLIFADGDVTGKICSGFEQILRTVAHMQAGTAEFRIDYLYRPSSKVGHKQQRLCMYLTITACCEAILKSLDCIIAGSILTRFYGLESVDGISFDDSKLAAVRYIKKHTSFVQPLHGKEFNPQIPSRYFIISPFEAAEDNDYMMLDKNLDKLSVPVVVALKVSSADISKNIRAHNQYLRQLCSVNRSFREDFDEDSFLYEQSLENSQEPSAAQLKVFNLKDPLADDISRIHRRFRESLLEPQLEFEFKVKSADPAVSHMIASTVANCAFTDGNYDICAQRDNSKSCDDNYSCLTELDHYAMVDELVGIMKLPAGSFSSALTIMKNNDPPSQEGENIVILGNDIQGFDYDDQITRALVSDLLCKHAAFFGLSGGGKTTLILSIMLRLWSLGIPFMVIESAKKEYRILKKFLDHTDKRVRDLARSLQIYTPGYDLLSPFRFNPLYYTDRIYELAHIESIKKCIESSIPVSCGSIPALIFEALENTYEKYRKLGKWPVMADLISEIEHVFSNKNYSGEIKSNMQTVIEVRLSSLIKSMIGKVYQCSVGTSIEKLIKLPSVFEIDMLQKEHKCNLGLFLLNAVHEYLSQNPIASSGKPRFVIIIEEAHNILGSSEQSVVSEDMTDPQIGAAELVSKLLLELRSLGGGLIICDQHPSNIHPSASKSVATKLSFRQSYSTDREELEKSMNMDPLQAQDIARAKPGEAYFITEGYYGARKIRTENLHEWLDLKENLSDEQLKAILEKQSWYRDTREDRVAHELQQLDDAVKEYENCRKKYKLRYQQLARQFIIILDKKDVRLRKIYSMQIFNQLKALKKQIVNRGDKFIRGSWKTFSYLEDDFEKVSSDLSCWGKSIFNQYRQFCEPQMELLLKSVEKCIKRVSSIYLKENYDGC